MKQSPTINRLTAFDGTRYHLTTKNKDAIARRLGLYEDYDDLEHKRARIPICQKCRFGRLERLLSSPEIGWQYRCVLSGKLHSSDHTCVAARWGEQNAGVDAES